MIGLSKIEMNMTHTPPAQTRHICFRICVTSSPPLPKRQLLEAPLIGFMTMLQTTVLASLAGGSSPNHDKAPFHKPKLYVISSMRNSRRTALLFDCPLRAGLHKEHAGLPRLQYRW